MKTKSFSTLAQLVATAPILPDDIYYATDQPVLSRYYPVESGILGDPVGGVLGTLSTVAALQSAYPAASFAGFIATVGVVAPYISYISNGTSWICNDLKQGDIRNYGAVCDAQASYLATLTFISGTTYTVSCSDITFTALDVGKIFTTLPNSIGTSGTVTTYYGTISSVNAGVATVALTLGPNASMSNMNFIFGTNDDAAITAAVAAANASNTPFPIYIPALSCTATATGYVLNNGVSMIGSVAISGVTRFRNWRYSGSGLFLCNYTANPFVQFGLTGSVVTSSGGNSGRLTNVMIYAGSNSLYAVSTDNCIGSRVEGCALIGGTVAVLALGPSSTVIETTIAGLEQQEVVKLAGDCMFGNGVYMYGAGPKYPVINMYANNETAIIGGHLWRCSDANYIGDLLRISGGGNITVVGMQFDTPMGASVNIQNISGLAQATSTISIIGCTNLATTAMVATAGATAVIAAASIAISSGIMTVSAITSGTNQGTYGTQPSTGTGTIFNGSLLTGNGVPAGTYVVKQLSNTGSTPGTLGTYQLGIAGANSTLSVATPSSTYYLNGFPYVQISLDSVSSLDMLIVANNQGYLNGASIYANMIDLTGVVSGAFVGGINVSGNITQGMQMGYGADGRNAIGTSFTPTIGAGTNMFNRSAKGAVVTY